MILTPSVISDRLQSAWAAAGDTPAPYAEINFTDESRLKCAAVLVPLLQMAGAWHLLYTRRTERVESHKGQVSFPGGACDDGDAALESTALREAQEEIGIEPSRVRILGRLTDLITVTSFRVTPIVGLVDWPTVFRLGEDEVERVFTIPLDWLADINNRWEFPLGDRNGTVIAYHPYDGELLWGATARMTVNFIKVLGL
jgi:8-oxo-dGTP pyrophosphatase MutT (NUDIX family)